MQTQNTRTAAAADAHRFNLGTPDLCVDAELSDYEAEQAAEPVKRLNVLPCPNPDCDPEDGCCVCEHTGRVYQFVIDAMTVAGADAEQAAAGDVTTGMTDAERWAFKAWEFDFFYG